MASSPNGHPPNGLSPERWLAPPPPAEMLLAARDFVEDGRVAPSPFYPLDVAFITEGGDLHAIRARRRGLWCSCPAGRRLDRWCVHRAAAAIRWAELVDALPPAVSDVPTTANGHLNAQLERDLAAVLP